MREGSKHFIKSIYFIISKYFDQIKWKILGSWFKNNTMKGLTLFKIIKFSLQSVNQTIFFYEKLKVGPAHHSFQTRPGPKPRSRVLAGSPGQFVFNQNNIVLVKTKNKSQQVATRFFTGFCQVSQVFSSPICSLTWPDSSPGSVGTRVTCRAEPVSKL